MGRYNQSASGAFFILLMRTRGLVIAVEALLSIALATGYPGRACAADGGFNATFEAMGGAHRMFRKGIDHPALKIGAWSIDSATHEVIVKFQIEEVRTKRGQSTILDRFCDRA